MELFKDKIFAISLTVAIVAAGLLVHSHFFSNYQPVSSAPAQNIHSSPNHSSSPVHNMRRTHHSTSSSTYSSPRSPSNDFVPVKKVRPKSGDNKWVVSNESHADTNDLTNVLTNMNDGDIISVGPGTFDLALGSISVSKVEVNGADGTTLNVSQKSTYKRGKELSLRNVTLVLHEDDRLRFTSEYTKVEFDRVNVETLMQIDVEATIEFNVKDSTFTNVTFSFADHSKAKFENSVVKRSSMLFKLNDYASLEITGGQFESFSSDAFYARSSFVKLKATGIKVMNGKFAFYGKFSEENSFIKDSEFKDLEAYTYGDSKVKCSMCQIHNIQIQR